MDKIAIVGSGFSSLSAACYLAKNGFEVDVYEKNDSIGGRARSLKLDGFTFDMGPSWYWMPDVFDRFFEDFNKQTSDYYDLIRLSPAYRVYFNDASHIDIPDNLPGIYEIFEQEEPGSSAKLKIFLKEAGYNYRVAIENLVYKPGLSPAELITPQTITKFNQFLSNISTQIRRRFKNEKLIKILEFPVLFLGAKPQDTPSFYNFMNYADFVLGTWYPKGGMYKVVEGIKKLAEELGVQFHTNAEIDKITTENKRVSGLSINGQEVNADIVLSGADYHHTESLLPPEFRSYSEEYWNKCTFAPSALIYYVGFDIKLKNINHHTLFFDQDFEKHAIEIYDEPAWPEAPLFYANFPSLSDDTVAPNGKESAFFLIPIAPDLRDTQELREKYFNDIIKRLELYTKQSLFKHIILNKSYCVSDFKSDYHSYKGNAYGLANTLRQTAFLRPKIKSTKLENLFFTGQLTVPGPGVPPALISGKIAAEQIIKKQKREKNHEIAV